MIICFILPSKLLILCGKYKENLYTGKLAEAVRVNIDRYTIII